MTQAKKKGLLLPFNIQLFAEGDNGGENTPPNNDNSIKPKHTDEEYDKLKSSHDKISSEIAELKKQLRSKQTDDEKKAEEEATRQKEVDDLKREVATYKIQSSLQESFEKDEVEKISKSILDGDIDSLVKNLVGIRKAYKEKIFKEAKEEFSKSAKIPGGNNDENDGVSDDVKAYLNGKKSKGKIDAKNYWLGTGDKKETK